MKTNVTTLQALRSERTPLVVLASLAMLSRVLLVAVGLLGAPDPVAANLLSLCAPSGGPHIAKVEGSTHTQNPIGIGCDCSHMIKQVLGVPTDMNGWQEPIFVVAGALALLSKHDPVLPLRRSHFLIRAPPVAIA